MANNEYTNKVVLGNQTLIDLTIDDVTAADVLTGKYFHLPSGQRVAGACPYDMDTSEMSAVAAEILSGKTAGVNGQTVTGTMPNRGAQTGEIDTKTGTVAIQQGYHDGSGAIGISATEQAKIIAENIKEGIVILGVTGTCSPASGVTAQAKNVTPYLTAQTITPDAGYDYLSQVVVAAISVTETDNAAGGKTVVIGDVAPAAA